MSRTRARGRSAGGAGEHAHGARRRRPAADARDHRRGPQHDHGPRRGRRWRRRALHDSRHGRRALRDARLHLALVPAPRHEPRRSRCDDHGRRALPADAHRLHRLHRPARRARAGRLARQGHVPEVLAAALRADRARAGRRDRAGGEHDDHDRRRADPRDRPDEGDRRHQPPDQGDLPAHGARAGRDRLVDRGGARRRDRELSSPTTSARRSTACRRSSAVYWPVLAASIVVGLVGPMLASLPAIRRAVRVPVREALEATGAELGGSTRLDRMLRRVAFMPPTFHIGVRSVGRRRRRSLATIVQIAFAVGTLLAVLGLASIGNRTRSGRPRRPRGDLVRERARARRVRGRDPLHAGRRRRAP